MNKTLKRIVEFSLVLALSYNCIAADPQRFQPKQQTTKPSGFELSEKFINIEDSHIGEVLGDIRASRIAYLIGDTGISLKLAKWAEENTRKCNLIFIPINYTENNKLQSYLSRKIRKDEILKTLKGKVDGNLETLIEELETFAMYHPDREYNIKVQGYRINESLKTKIEKQGINALRQYNENPHKSESLHDENLELTINEIYLISPPFTVNMQPIEETKGPKVAQAYEKSATAGFIDLYREDTDRINANDTAYFIGPSRLLEGDDNIISLFTEGRRQQQKKDYIVIFTSHTEDVGNINKRTVDYFITDKPE